MFIRYHHGNNLAFFLASYFSLVSLTLTCLITLSMLQSYVGGDIFFHFQVHHFILGYYGIGLHALRLKTVIALM